VPAFGLENAIMVVTCGFLWLRVRLSGGDLVLARESAEHLLSADPVLGEVDVRWPGVSLSRCELAKGTVRPGGVVVQQVFGQHPAFALGACGGLAIILMPSALNTASKASVNWPARSLIRNLTGVAPWPVHHDVAGCLCRPCAVRVRGDAGQVNAAGAVLDDDEGVNAPQWHGVHVKGSRRRGSRRPGRSGTLPGRARAAGRWIDPGTMEDLPHCGSSDRWPSLTSSPWTRRCAGVDGRAVSAAGGGGRPRAEQPEGGSGHRRPARRPGGRKPGSARVRRSAAGRRPSGRRAAAGPAVR
jgi:hypothetical protein